MRLLRLSDGALLDDDTSVAPAESHVLNSRVPVILAGWFQVNRHMSPSGIRKIPRTDAPSSNMLRADPRTPLLHYYSIDSPAYRLDHSVPLCHTYHSVGRRSLMVHFSSTACCRAAGINAPLASRPAADTMPVSKVLGHHHCSSCLQEHAAHT